MQRKGLMGCAVVSLLILSLFINGCGKKEAAKEEAPLVRSLVVKRDNFGQSASYAGEVKGRYETQLAFQVGGKIIRRNVELGSTVNPGDVLMEIDAKDIRQTVNITAAQVYSAESQLNLAESNLERYRQLYEQGAISRAQLDQYQNAYAVATASVRQSSAQYAQGANQLGYSELVADAAGVVSAIGAEAGQVVSAGQSVLTLVKEGEREVEINIPENRVEELRQAKQLRVSFWALPNVVVEGKVREISPVADKAARTYKVRISLLNPPPGITLGMTAKVMTANPDGQPTASIPLAAIFQTGDTPCVWVINDGVVALRPVRVGAFGDDKIQVLEGLQDGDVIVTAGVQKLREGQKVRV